MPRPTLSAAATPPNGNTAHTTTTMNTINATTTTSSTTPATPQDTRTQKRRSARFQSGSGTPADTDTPANIPAPTPIKMQQIPTDHKFTPKKHTLPLSPSGPGRVSPKRKRESTVAQEELQRLSERSSQLQPQPHSQPQNASGDRILRVTTRAEKRRRLSMPEPPDAISTPTTPNGRKGEKRKLGGQVAGDHGDANGDGEREDGEGDIGKEDVDGVPRRGRGRPRKKRRKSLGDVGSITPILRRTSRHRSHSRSRSTHTRSRSLIVTASSSSPSGSLSKPKSKLEEGLFKQKQKQKLGRGAGSPLAKPSPISTPSSSTEIPATPTPKLPPTSKPSTSTPTSALLTPAHKTRLSTSSIPTPITSGTPQRRRSTRTRGRPSAASASDDTSNHLPIDDPSNSPIPLSKVTPLRMSPPSSTSSLTLNSPLAPTAAVPLPASTSITTASAATSGTTPEPRRVTRASLASGAGISLTTTNLVPVPPSPSVLSTAALSSPPVSPILAPSSPVSPIDIEMAPPALSLQRQTASVFPGRITRSRTARMSDAVTSLNGGAVSNSESPSNSSLHLDATGNLNTNASLRIDVDVRKRAAGARERSPLAVLPPQSLATMEHEGEEEEEQARGEQVGDVERGVKGKKKEKGKVPVSLRRSRRLSRLGPGSEMPSTSASASVGRSSPAKPTPSSPLAIPPDALSGDPSKPSSNTSTSAASSSPAPNQIASTSSIPPPSSQPPTQTAPSSTPTSTSSPPTNRNPSSPLSLSPPTNRLSLNTFGYGYGHSAGYKSSPLSPTKPLLPGVSSPAAGGSGGDGSAEASGSGAASTPAQGMPTGKAHTSSNTHTPTHTPPTSPTRSPRVIDAVDFGLPLLGVGGNPAASASGSAPSNANASAGPAVSGAAPASTAKGKEKEKEKEKEGEAREKEAAPASGGTLTETGVPDGQPRPSRPKLSLEIDRGAEEGSQGAGVSSSPIAVSSTANPPVAVPVAVLPANAGESESGAGEVSGPEAEARVLSSSLLFSGGSESAQVQVQAQASASFDAGIPEVEKDSEMEAEKEREREQDGQVQDPPVENRFEPSLPSGQPLRQDEYAYVDRMDVDMSLSPAPSALQMQPVLESGSAMDERTLGNDQIPPSLAPPQEPLQLQQPLAQSQQPQYYYQSPPPPPPPVVHPVYSPTWEEPPKLESEKNLWRLACKVRVWDMRRRYSLETIRALVLQEAHEYYAIHGFPPGYFGRGSGGSSSNASSSNSSPLSPSFDASSSMHPSDAEQSDNRSPIHMMPALSPLNPNRGVSISNNSEPGASSPLNFMEEPVYDWEIASSDDDEEDYEGDEEGAVESVDEAGRKGKAKDLGVNDSPKSTSGNSASGVSEDEDEDEDEGEEERMVAQRKEKRKMLLEKKREAVLAQGKASSKSKGKGKAKMVEGEESASTTPTPQEVQHDNEEDDDDDLLDDLDDVDEAMLDIEMDLDDALHDPSFNFELSSPTSPTLNLMLGSSTNGNRSVMGSPSPTTPGPAPGVFNAFYVPPVSPPVHDNNENSPPPISVPPMHPTDPTSTFLEGGYIDQQPGMNASAGPSSLADPMSPGSNAGSGLVLAVPPASPDSMVPPREHSHTPPAMRVPRMAPMILELPPPKLSTVPVWLLRNTDMMVGGSMGKGTPVDRGRAAAWATASSSPRKSVGVELNGMAVNVGMEGGSVVGSTGSGSSIGSSDSNVNDATRPVESPSENGREGESSSGVGGVREEGMHSLPGSGNVLSAQLKEEQVESDKSFLTLSASGNSVTDSSTGSGSTSSSSFRKDAQTAKVEEDVIVDPGFMPTADWDAFIASLTLSNSNTNGNSNGNAGMTPGGDTLGLGLSASPIERSPGVPPQPQSHMITAFHSHVSPSPSSTSFMSTFHNGFLGGQQAFMLNPGAMGTPNVNVPSGNVPPPSPGSTTSLPSSSSSSPCSSPSTQQDNYGSLVNVHTPGTNGFQGHQPSSPTFGMNVNVGLFGGPGSVDGLNAMNTMFGMPIHPSNQGPSMGVNYNYNMGVGMGVNPMGMNMTMPIQIPTVQNLGIPGVGVPMSLGNAGNGNGTGTVPMSGMGMGLVPSFSSLNGLNTMNAMNMPGMNINPAMGAMGMGFTTGIGVGGMQLGVGLTLSLGPSPTHQHHHQQQSNLLLASGSSNPIGASLATENANTNIASQDGPTSQNPANGGNNNGSTATNSNTPSTLSFALG